MPFRHFERLLGLLCEWAKEQERIVCKSGIPLDQSQLADAKEIGVVEPERVRLLEVKHIPVPAHSELHTTIKTPGLNFSNHLGLTVRYGIFLRSDKWSDRPLLRHKLAHTSQYERLGSFELFLRLYLFECLFQPGYPYGFLEKEAKRAEWAPLNRINLKRKLQPCGD